MQAALPALGGLLGAFGSQSRSNAAPAVPRVDTSTSAIAGARDRKAARLAVSNAERERLLAVLTDPQVMGLLTVFSGLLAANHIPWSADPAKRAALSGVAASSAVLMGLGRAGVGDLTTLAVATGAGVASALAGSGGESALLPTGGGGFQSGLLANDPVMRLINMVRSS